MKCELGHVTQTEGRFYENLVFIVLIVGSELDMIKKSITTRESTFIELIVYKKISVLGLKLVEKCLNLSKNVQNRDFEPRSQGN